MCVSKSPAEWLRAELDDAADATEVVEFERAFLAAAWDIGWDMGMAAVAVTSCFGSCF